MSPVQSIGQYFDTLHPFHVFVTAPMIVMFTVFWAMSAAFALCDFVLERRGALHRHKRQPWAKGTRLDWRLYGRTAMGALRNQLIVSIPLTLLLYPVWQLRGVTYTAPLPAFWVMALQFGVIIFIQEAGFYYVHRFLHRPTLFARIHRHHHAWNQPVAVSAHYAHPLEHFFANSLPFVAGPLLVGLHWQLMLLWFAVATFTVVRSHSGYRWLFLGSAEHERHHRTARVNFGIMMWFDRWHHTLWGLPRGTAESGTDARNRTAQAMVPRPASRTATDRIAE